MRYNLNYKEDEISHTYLYITNISFDITDIQVKRAHSPQNNLINQLGWVLPNPIIKLTINKFCNLCDRERPRYEMLGFVAPVLPTQQKEHKLI